MVVTMFHSTIEAQDSLSAIDTKGSLVATNKNVEILTNFKATRVQKKVIKKVKKYVTPRVLKGRRVRTDVLEGKTVTIQMHIDANGNIGNFAIVKGIEPKLDNIVVSLIKEYDTVKPFSTTSIAKPATIQLEIAVVAKKYSIN